MFKFKSHILLFAISIILGSSFQTLSADQWYQDGQDEQGRRKLKNDSTEQIKWSSEHLDPQVSRPSLTSTVWIAHKYTITKNKFWKQFSFHIVTSEGTHGSITGDYLDGSPMKIIYFPKGNIIDEGRYAKALDLVLDELSRYHINFLSFNIHVYRAHAALGAIIEQIAEEETKSKHPSASKISSLYNLLSVDERNARKGHMIAGVFMDMPSLDWTILRRANNQP